MADLIQINTQIPQRDYNQNHQNSRQNNIQQPTSGQVFDLGNQNRVVKTNDRTNDHAQQDLKDSGSNTIRSGADSIKNPTAALNTAKALISRETISLVRESGDTDTLGKLTEFASEVMLSPSTLSDDMAAQQKNSTIYGDKIWAELKELNDMTDSAALTEAIADFAKAAAAISSKDEILRSLAANFRYLAGEAAPGKAVADELLAAAKALSGTDAAQNYAALKPTLLKLIGYTEHSLLLNDDTQNLLPLIIHNMSRYTDSTDSLKASFSSLLNITDSLLLTARQRAALGLGEGEELSDMLSKLFDSYISKNEYLSAEAKLTSLINNDAALREAQLRSDVNLLAAGAKHMAGRIPSDVLMRNLSSIDFNEGAPALQKALGSVIPNTPAMRNALASLFNNLEQTGDLDKMVNQLNTILENIGENDSQNMMRLAQGLNTALNAMAAGGQYSCTGVTSMETLADFLTKNINNSFLQSLSGMNQGDMVQNMLTAPGVFAPLIHQFVPLDAFGLRAFGEMWVDPESEEALGKIKGGGSTDETGSHVFLCFDIEDTGYFELEIYEKDKGLNVTLLCPEGMESSFPSIKSAIPQIAAANGYKVNSASVGEVREKRSLDKVFPKLSDRRTNLNIKI